ncbi:hypothetical protein [Nocardioides sp. NPDC006303]|uniref:hypothetical protein n=1 Tax=Nocardioides sp. NPDC006303 TaxID=3156747 RepID=UPI0033AADB28
MVLDLDQWARALNAKNDEDAFRAVQTIRSNLARCQQDLMFDVAKKFDFAPIKEDWVGARVRHALMDMGEALDTLYLLESKFRAHERGA